MSRSDTATIPIPAILTMRNKPAVALLMLSGLALNFLWAKGHDMQRCIEIVLLCISTLILLRRSAAVPPVIQSVSVSVSAGRLLLAFFLFGLASAASAYSPRYGLYEWSSLLLLAFFAFGISSELARARNKGMTAILQFLGIVCALYSLRVLIAYVASLIAGYQVDMHSLAVGFSNVRFLNHTQTALLPLIVLLCLQAPAATAMKRAWFVLAAFWWSLLFVSEARATILALVAGSGLTLLLRRAHAREFLKIMVLSALAGAVIYGLAFILLPILVGLQPIGMPSNVLARTAADPSSGRTLLWKLALQLIAAHPWLGVGPHHFAHEGHKLYIGAHPHDWMLQIAAEWGVPALLCLLSAVALGARGLVRSGKRIAADDLRNQQILVALLATCAAIFVDGLFSGVLVMPQSQLAIALVIGCTVGWTRSLDTSAAVRKPAPVARFVAAVFVAAALGGLVWSVAPDFLRHARGEALTPAEQAINNKGNWPRLWETGYF